MTGPSESTPAPPDGTASEPSIPNAEGAFVLFLVLTACDFLFVCLAPPGQSSAAMTKTFAAMTTAVVAYWVVGKADFKTTTSKHVSTYTGGFALFMTTLIYFNPIQMQPECSLSVYANKNDWQSTGMFIQNDQLVFIKPNRDKWCLSRASKKKPGIECNAEGLNRHAKGSMIPSANLGTLIARIGDDGEAYPISLSGATLSRPTGAGYLQLMCNDDYFGDNSGSLNVFLFKDWKPPLMVAGFEALNKKLSNH